MVADRDMRSKEIELLLGLLASAADDAEPQLREVLAKGVLDRVFDVAWEHQFERERTSAQREIRDVVQEAVAEVVESHAD
jgi:hypothetical protein